MSGIGKELGGVGETLRRSNDKADQMAARAAAMESLTEEGILDNPFDNRDDVAKELDKIKRDAAVVNDLERLKRELKSE
jgi:phage shock protein A